MQRNCEYIKQSGNQAGKRGPKKKVFPERKKERIRKESVAVCHHSFPEDFLSISIA